MSKVCSHWDKTCKTQAWPFNLWAWCYYLFMLTFPNRTQFTKETTMLSIQTSWPSGRCLTNWQRKKRKNSSVSSNTTSHVRSECTAERRCYSDERKILMFGLSMSIVSVNEFKVNRSWVSPFVSPVFLTGCDRIPFQGMKMVKMTVAVLPDATDLALPESLTCHLLLLLPMYQRDPVETTMKTRLLQAINHNRGFWKEEAAGRG